MIRLLLVDDQPLARAGLARILDPQPDLCVVGECDDGDGVVAAVAATRPDVVVMDIRMKRVDGAEAIARLHAASDAPPPVLVLTTFDDDETLAAALGAGASGFLLKDAPGEDIVRAVRRVAAGEGWLDPQVTARVLHGFRTTAVPRATATARLADLTERETEVLALVGRGLSNSEVAAELVIGEGTVKTHVGHILAKLGLRDRPAMIVLAYESGLVGPGG